MKKLFFILIAVLGIAMSSFAASTKDSKTLEATKSAVTTFHDDVKDIVSTLHEDTKSITSTLYGDGKDAVTALYPDVKSAVVAIGKAIGVAAEHVYTVLVKKFVVDGIVQLLPFLLGLLLIGFGWYKLSKYLQTHEAIEWRILYPVFLVIYGIIALCNVDYNTMVMGLVNPEYGALNYILEYSKTMLK
jgi:hypothetical protein